MRLYHVPAEHRTRVMSPELRRRRMSADSESEIHPGELFVMRLNGRAVSQRRLKRPGRSFILNFGILRDENLVIQLVAASTGPSSTKTDRSRGATRHGTRAEHQRVLVPTATDFTD
ncbi:hypothetical protein EVAR_46926_1 [Eumeta japonica]|uniref:Uncharacterized protein n=1 Tax=Eumeta variegata TaxID=151549 RepID=A0A4C1XYA7_EUMVA|nr:hypothetical protein EVAR_46926_1 [Eumeta japonica]